eukprot:GEMP01092952.1.p1 GENE.GEMP01092952.1~~GEMP01092952.1.p1  ORF type:complete len:161 (+),score=24.98 GEMP01092952.1:139-621(+)
MFFPRNTVWVNKINYSHKYKYTYRQIWSSPPHDSHFMNSSIFLCIHEAPSYLITPYATELTPAPSILRTTAQMDAMSPNAPNLPHFRRGEMERPSGRQQVDRTTCMGDIIGWTGLPAEKQDGPVPPNFWRNNGDIITWGVNHATENLASESSPKGRHGRK